METRLILVFFCTMWCVTEAQPLTQDCDPLEDPTCYYNSYDLSTNSYIQALLKGINVVFMCKNENMAVNISFVYQLIIQNDTLNHFNITTKVSQLITSIHGSVTANQRPVHCILNTTFSSNFTLMPVNAYIFFALINETLPGNASTLFNTNLNFNFTLDANIFAAFLNGIAATSTTLQQNITRTGCGSSKLCFSSEPKCDPAGPSSCFFGSVQLLNQTFLFELSGTTSGYVALGLTKAGSTVVFACGNNNNTFFFQPTSQNGTKLTPADLNTAYSYQGVVTQKQNLIQCIFNTSTIFNITTKGSDTTYIVTLLNGTTNGTTLGSANVLYNSTKAIDLSDPNALNSATSVCVNVVTALLSVLTLWLL